MHRPESCDFRLLSGPSRVHAAGGQRVPAVAAVGSADVTEEADTKFEFQYLRYPSVKVAESKKLVTRWTSNNGKSLVYFNRDLRVGRKLILQIESVSPGPEYGLAFGVTSCCPSQVYNHPYHLVDFCRPEYDCCGISLWMKLHRWNRNRSWVAIERVYDGFIRFTFDGRFKKDMYDPPERGFGRCRSYPFLMLTGCVSAVRILSVAPAVRQPLSLPPQPSVPGLNLRPLDTSYPIDTWISNRNVALENGNHLKRKTTTGCRNYIFNSRAFEIGKSINLQVKEIDPLVPGTITFGVTTYAPESVSFNNLPTNSNELITNRFSKNWYLSQDIIESIRTRQSLSLKRTVDGFTVKTGFKQIRYLFYVDPLLTVYPFFNFNGSVRSIEIVTNSFATFNMTAMARELQSPTRPPPPLPSSSEGKCVICLDAKADHMVSPCKHVALCQSCSAQTMTQSERKCPLCRKTIEIITKIFLA